MKVDWNVDTEGGGGLYEAGTYKVAPKEITEVEAKSSGNMQLRIKSTITEGALKGKQITDHITLVDSCGWKLVKFFKMIGVDTSKLESLDTSSGAFRNLLNRCIGRTMYWQVDVVPGRDGKDRNEISDYILDEEASWDSAADEPEFLKD